MSKKPKSKISNLPPINYEISLENEVIRDNQGNFYNLNQSHSGDFRVFAIAIFSGARLMESEVKKMIGINVKTGRKKYGGDADVFLYHYKKRMSSGKVGKKFETDWCIRDRDPRNQIMYYLNPKYRKLVTP